MLGIPAEQEALRRYRALTPERRALLEAAISRVCAIATAHDVPVSIAWASDLEFDAWREFVLTADVAGPVDQPRLWDELIHALADAVSLAPSELQNWLIKTISVEVRCPDGVGRG